MDKHLVTSNNIPEIKMTLYVWRSKLILIQDSNALAFVQRVWIVQDLFDHSELSNVWMHCIRPETIKGQHVGGTNPFIFISFRSGKCKPWTHNNHHSIYIYRERESRTVQIFLHYPIIEITLSLSVLTQCRFKIILHLNEKQYGHKSQVNKNVTCTNS
jgi:hypothetical protein